MAHGLARGTFALRRGGAIPSWPMIDERLIADAGRRLVAAAPGARVILFGSHGRGEAAPHSDLDFLVVEPEVEDDGREAVRLMRVLRDLRVPADVTVVSERYAEDWRDVRGPRARCPLTRVACSPADGQPSRPRANSSPGRVTTSRQPRRCFQPATYRMRSSPFTPSRLSPPQPVFRGPAEEPVADPAAWSVAGFTLFFELGMYWDSEASRACARSTRSRAKRRGAQ